jgi:sugar phosphate isomerase/epimerase
MRLAFSTISCPDYNPVEIAAAARAFGYDGVELYALAGRRLTPDVLGANLDALRAALTQDGIPVVCLNSWASLSSADPAAHAAQAELVVHAFDLARELACPLVKAFGGELPPGENPAHVYDYMAETIARLAEEGERRGVRLVVETHDGFSRGATLAELLRRVDHHAFAALWDIHHPYRLGEQVAETDALIGARVAHVHVKDSVRRDDGWRFTMLGEGELPVADAIVRLAGRGYDGYLSVDWEKMWHPEIPGPEVALPGYAAVLRRYLALARERTISSAPPVGR